ncbi:hypothetical protein BD413DRAFT_217919 [Trametes elegans]|nr:hypothetical protein BD413DRAFT_217919 [Trametes elegans]
MSPSSSIFSVFCTWPPPTTTSLLLASPWLPLCAVSSASYTSSSYTYSLSSSQLTNSPLSLPFSLILLLILLHILNTSPRLLQSHHSTPPRFPAPALNQPCPLRTTTHRRESAI